MQILFIAVHNNCMMRGGARKEGKYKITKGLCVHSFEYITWVVSWGSELPKEKPLISFFFFFFSRSMYNPSHRMILNSFPLHPHQVRYVLLQTPEHFPPTDTGPLGALERLRGRLASSTGAKMIMEMIESHKMMTQKITSPPLWDSMKTMDAMALSWMIPFLTSSFCCWSGAFSFIR